MPALWGEVRRALRVTVDDVNQGLAQHLSQGAPARDASAPPALSPDRAQALAAEVLDGLRRGEPLESALSELLDGVSAWVSASARQAVSQAVDDFEFDAAITALEAVMAQVPEQEMGHVDG